MLYLLRLGKFQIQQIKLVEVRLVQFMAVSIG
jgi:hypothetical protein